MAQLLQSVVINLVHTIEILGIDSGEGVEGLRLYCKVTIILAPQQTNSFYYKTLEGKVVQLTTDHHFNTTIDHSNKYAWYGSWYPPPLARVTSMHC